MIRFMKTAQECVGKRVFYSHRGDPQRTYQVDVVRAFKNPRNDKWILEVNTREFAYLGLPRPWEFDSGTWWQKIPYYIDRWKEKLRNE